MNRLYSIRDFQYYTMLKQVLYDLELANKDYLWLISDIEAYPKKEKYQGIVKDEYLLMSTRELVEMLEYDDFQWVWAVFSAIPSNYKREDILKFDLPYIQGLEGEEHNLFEGVPETQHPYAEFEICAFDSAYFFMTTDNEELIMLFKKRYPLYDED